MKTPAIWFIPIGLLTLLGCSEFFGQVKGTGTPVRKVIEVEAFSELVNGGDFEVVISKGAAQHIEIEAQAELIDLVRTDVSGGSWNIRTTKGYSTDAPFIIHITTPKLTGLTIEGSGDIRSEDVFGGNDIELDVSGSGAIAIAHLDVERIEAQDNGSGDITLGGTASELDADIIGSGTIQAAELTCNEAEVTITGSGDASLTAISKLAISITGSGSVRYRGKPDITTDITGSGTVAPLP
jgi:hypothetical protein